MYQHERILKCLNPFAGVAVSCRVAIRVRSCTEEECKEKDLLARKEQTDPTILVSTVATDCVWFSMQGGK